MSHTIGMLWWRLRQGPGRRRALLALAGAVVLAVGAVTAVRLAGRAGPDPRSTDPAVDAGVEPASTPTILVFVSGAVAHPGLYRLTAQARVADALAAAGGITRGADPGHLPNEAARIRDGHQVNVPFVHSGGRQGGGAPRLDINTAGIEDLRALPGMPVGLAEAIVDHRSRWGAFTTVAELKDALGVDRATVTALGRELRVGPGS